MPRGRTRGPIYGSTDDFHERRSFQREHRQANPNNWSDRNQRFAGPDNGSYHHTADRRQYQQYEGQAGGYSAGYRLGGSSNYPGYAARGNRHHGYAANSHYSHENSHPSQNSWRQASSSYESGQRGDTSGHRGRGRGGRGGRGRGGAGGNPNRPPPHLKGREIGLWHARKQKERKGLSGAAGAAVAAQEPGKILTKADKAYIQQHSSRMKIDLDVASQRRIRDVLNRYSVTIKPKLSDRGAVIDPFNNDNDELSHGEVLENDFIPLLTNDTHYPTDNSDTVPSSGKPSGGRYFALDRNLKAHTTHHAESTTQPSSSSTRSAEFKTERTDFADFQSENSQFLDFTAASQSLESYNSVSLKSLESLPTVKSEPMDTEYTTNTQSSHLLTTANVKMEPMDETERDLTLMKRIDKDIPDGLPKWGMPRDMSMNDQLKVELQSSQQSNPLTQFRRKLPASSMKQDLLAQIKENQVVVISGETGCGKTTQVPQFILDDMIENNFGSCCNIVCTQPRRISAISVAERVAEERNEELGTSVGYSIRLANVLPRKYASITYCTTGILLRRLEHDSDLDKLSHVIVDEVHERDINTDFLLIILRDVLARRPDLKVILMSATLNADQFSEYYYGAPMFNIPGFTYPVTEYYLEDVIDIVEYDPPKFMQNNYRFYRSREARQQRKYNIDEAENLKTMVRRDCESLSEDGLEAIALMDHSKVHHELVAGVIEHICHTEPPGAILVFLPGWGDITEVNKIISRSLPSSSVRIIPLHSLISTKEQRTVFKQPPAGVRKIVLATNIAETSITIDDIVYVVNSGKIKMKDFDANRNMSTLDTRWVSRANSKQRKGRAGRVQSGICYHLYTRHHERSLLDYQRPEMIRTRLENVCLDVKLLGQGKVEPFLLKAMNPPSQAAIEMSIELLKTLKAFDNSERLTPLGFHLARLPMDPQTGKMALMAAIFCCLEPVLSIAACLSFKDPFIITMENQRDVDRIRKQFSMGHNSDHLMLHYTIKVF